MRTRPWHEDQLLITGSKAQQLMQWETEKLSTLLFPGAPSCAPSCSALLARQFHPGNGFPDGLEAVSHSKRFKKQAISKGGLPPPHEGWGTK